MKAVCWYGKQDVRVQEVEEPQILQSTDAIIEVTRSAICGSDLHLYHGYIPTMKPGDILGHEAMGIVREVGEAVKELEPGDRIVVPFPISCGKCWYCEHELPSLCDNSNPNAAIPEKLFGSSPAGIYGYSHAFGGFAGGQAQFLRVPYADNDHLKVPESLSDDQVLFLSDVLPTAWTAAEWCDIKPGDSVAVWGGGPIGQFSAHFAKIMGAEKVFLIDHVQARLDMAEQNSGAVPLHHGELGMTGVQRELRMRTGGRGPDSVIDAVGLEATDGLLGTYHKAKQSLKLEQDRPIVLHEAIMACRKGGNVSVPGDYTGMIDKFPMGAVHGKGLHLHAGQAPVQRHMRKLLGMIERGEFDPTFIITHEASLEEAPEMYRMFNDKQDEIVKVVLRPH